MKKRGRGGGGAGRLLLLLQVSLLQMVSKYHKSPPTIAHEQQTKPALFKLGCLPVKLQRSDTQPSTLAVCVRNM